jgi:hypothetical protein
VSEKPLRPLELIERGRKLRASENFLCDRAPSCLPRAARDWPASISHRGFSPTPRFRHHLCNLKHHHSPRRNPFQADTPCSTNRLAAQSIAMSVSRTVQQSLRRCKGHPSRPHAAAPANALQAPSDQVPFHPVRRASSQHQRSSRPRARGGMPSPSGDSTSPCNHA